MRGFLVNVSHLNAHTPNGNSWSKELVQTGHRAGGGNATWEIEVHRNDQLLAGDGTWQDRRSGSVYKSKEATTCGREVGLESATTSTSSTQNTTIPVDGSPLPTGSR
jgi:hypothetical protein